MDTKRRKRETSGVRLPKHKSACKIAGCDTPSTKREMCEKHYKAWSREQTQCRAQGCKAILLPTERKTRSDYCRLHEQQALTSRSPAAQAKTLARFREAIEPDWFFGCWMWKETPNQDTYGVLHAGTPWLAHRFAYVWFYGGHKRHLTLDHLCNRTLCVRPDHMQVVSKTLNTARRDKRVFAPPLKPYLIGHVPTNDSMNDWAKANGLPYGNPEWWDSLPTEAGPPDQTPLAWGDIEHL